MSQRWVYYLEGLLLVALYRLFREPGGDWVQAVTSVFEVFFAVLFAVGYTTFSEWLVKKLDEEAEGE